MGKKTKAKEGELLPQKKGHPSLYKPHYKDEIVDLMAQGYTDSRICAKWGISANTFYRWLREKEELKEAHERGKQAAEAWWEEAGIAGMMGQIKGFNSRIYQFTMQHKFKWNNQQQSNTSNQTINIENMNINKMSEDDLDLQISKKLKQLDIIEERESNNGQETEDSSTQRTE